jgi:hypothetical protein
MPDLIDDVPLPRGTWVRLTPHGPAAHFAVMNIGSTEMRVKKGGASAPLTAFGAMRVGPGRMLPPEDLTLHGYDVWAMSEASDGRAAVEAIQV